MSAQIIHNGMTDSTCILKKDDVIQSTRGKKREEMRVYETYDPVEVFPYERIFSKPGRFLKKQTRQIKPDTLNKTLSQ